MQLKTESNYAIVITPQKKNTTPKIWIEFSICETKRNESETLFENIKLRTKNEKRKKPTINPTINWLNYERHIQHTTWCPLGG